MLSTIQAIKYFLLNNQLEPEQIIITGGVYKMLYEFAGYIKFILKK
jgi:hypothetical protein